MADESTDNIVHINGYKSAFPVRQGKQLSLSEQLDQALSEKAESVLQEVILPEVRRNIALKLR
ncbi:hypothetical protein [Sulfitobacter pacificus]|uniref:Uncharacterized protein n=1 Tax=Sulfitobacter pacificus TaxID=1499314 RepID=A0ABQ5VED4_9RHOB|nr:hypothetical protein [Sulfitobacter pacificus]GLQ25450.1 hypothetical protein GCM10007927_02530 [Sulfitobacter pacificus]